MSTPAAGPPRVAFFTDSFHEVNGVALTSRQLDAYARRNGLPFLSIHRGPETRRFEDGPAITLEFQRSAASWALDSDLYFDPLFGRFHGVLRRALREFKPDVIHITGPNDPGIAGLYWARAMKIPLVASWHTNLHEYAGRRVTKLLRRFPEASRRSLSRAAENRSLDCCMLFYRAARVILAPNQELVDLLHRRTGRPCLLMERGSDTRLFDPAKRARTDSLFHIGFVGRITPEKNVRFFERLEKALLARGLEFRITLVGAGSEREWLEANLTRASFPGVQEGERLARAYADFDLLVFPSWTDTYGNVVVEALSSGVPAVVTTGGGPKFLVRDGETGRVCPNDEAMIEAVAGLSRQRERLREMSAAARRQACEKSWDRVFENVWAAYAEAARAVSTSLVPACR